MGQISSAIRNPHALARIGAKIRAERVRQRIMLIHFAKLTTLTIQTLIRIEDGRSDFSVCILLKIAEVLHLDPGELLANPVGGSLFEEARRAGKADKYKVPWR